ncbi:hypothetical protein LCGC14_2432190, partial [marine sediment metagenome]
MEDREDYNAVSIQDIEYAEREPPYQCPSDGPPDKWILV